MIKAILRFMKTVSWKILGINKMHIFGNEKPIEKYQISHLFDSASERQYYESSDFTLKK